jgi:hypothetical protein
MFIAKPRLQGWFPGRVGRVSALDPQPLGPIVSAPFSKWDPIVRLVMLCIGTLSTFSPCSADSPVAIYVFPAGGQRGSNISFRLGGYDLHEGCPLEMVGPGLKPSVHVDKAEHTIWFEGPVIPLPDSQAQESYPRDCIGQVAIDADTALGWRRLRVRNSQGVSNWLKFVVGDLPEVVEHEIDGAPVPTAVEAPVTINGRIFPREDVDIWTLEAKKGHTYNCDVMAERLGSPVDSHLIVIDPQGTVIAENADHFGRDSRLQFTANETGTYQVRIHDENFGGLQHYVYRLTITDGPYLESIYPLGGSVGTTVAFELSGQNLMETTVEQKLPDHMARSDRTLLSTELSKLSRLANGVPLELSSLPELLEKEPTSDSNNGLATQEPVRWPTVLNGRIDRAGDIDIWRFEARKGDSVDIEVHASSLGSPIDSVLTISDDQGKELMANDDKEKGQTDSRLVFRAPQDGFYELRVRDQFPNRGGSAFGYRIWMQATETAPDFELQIAQDLLHVPRGADTKIKVKVQRKNGLNAPITLTLSGLPEDVTVAGTTIAEKKNETELVFHASDTAKIRTSELRIHGTSTHGGQTMERSVRFAGKTPSDHPAETMTLAVSVSTPFKIFGQFETKYAARGSTYIRHFSINRGGFTGPIVVGLAERQVRHLQGVTGPTMVIPENVSEFDYPLHLAPWMEIGRTSRTCLMGVGEITDQDGTVHKVSFTSGEQFDQIIVLVDPGQLDIRLNRSSLKAVVGGEAEVEVRIGRGNGVAGPVAITLVTPEHIQCVTAEPLQIAGDQSGGKLKLKFASDKLDPLNMPLIVRATAQVNGYAYTAEETLSIVDPSAVNGIQPTKRTSDGSW